jgi:hydroxymethylpyrimidine pyrophosphatase-like HAD family hydrolase
MYEAMIEMMNQDKISFTASYDHKGYLTVFDIDENLLKKEKKRISDKIAKEQKLEGKELEIAVKEELANASTIKTKTIKLDWQDELALANIDALKEELVNMARKRHDSGKDSFDLIPEKANKLHDDRAYCAAMSGWALAEERRKLILKKPKSSTEDLLTKLTSQIRPSSLIKK